MGLGPPVCMNCRIIYKMIDKYPWWQCPKCGLTKTNKCHWELSKEDQQEFSTNTKE